MRIKALIMAESIIFHFSESEMGRINKVFNELGEFVVDSWSIPTNKEYRIIIYPYTDYACEYDECEKSEVEDSLGDPPKLSYCFELRRSVQNEACDISKQIISNSLLPFEFVVDDCLEKVWKKSEIMENMSDFLKQYYYRNST